MILQRQPNLWTCTPTAWAMAIPLSLEQVLKEIGHDGSKIQRPDEPEPRCRRGFHPQELVRVALKHGRSVTYVELFPVLNGLVLDQLDNWNYFKHLIQTSYGVIDGQGYCCNHSVAYSFGLIYDPAGEIYLYSKEACEKRGFFTQCLWRINVQ